MILSYDDLTFNLVYHFCEFYNTIKSYDLISNCFFFHFVNFMINGNVYNYEVTQAVHVCFY